MDIGQGFYQYVTYRQAGDAGYNPRILFAYLFFASLNYCLFWFGCKALSLPLTIDNDCNRYLTTKQVCQGDACVRVPVGRSSAIALWQKDPTPARGGGGGRQRPKTVCVPKTGLRFLMNSIRFVRTSFLNGGGGGAGVRRGLARAPNDPPAPEKKQGPWNG